MSEIDKKKQKICLISSSGGHFEQILCLEPLSKRHDCFIVTEKTRYNENNKRIKYFLKQTNRKEIASPFKMLYNALVSYKIFKKEKPDVIITTGAMAVIPMIYIAHKHKKKVIFIESFAKVTSPTRTGRYVYHKGLVDKFYVQWPSMRKFYPDAECLGGIY